MKNCLPKLPENPADIFHLPYASDGDFNQHDLIEHVIKFYNIACSLRLSSFSISENAVRSLLRLRQDGLLARASCIFDLSVKRHRLGLLFFGVNVADEIYLSKNHSKIILFDFGAFKLCSVGSANMNVNDKLEAGMITNDSAVYAFFLDVFNNKTTNSLKIDNNEFI
jgi:hypothetical protein